MATDNYKHDGAVTIKLSHDNDEITVWPSVEAPGSVTIALLDSEEPRTNVGIATPAECDALIAAIGRASGRPAPTSTPLEARLLDAIEAADEHAEKGWSLGVEAEDLAAAKGKAEGLRAALAMVREQGATVPRGALSEALDLLDEAIGHIENGVSECAEPRRDLARLRAILTPRHEGSQPC